MGGRQMVLIPIIIPTGSVYTARVSGSKVRRIVCDQCGASYRFEVSAEGIEGTGENPFWLMKDAAQREAVNDAYRTLERYLDGLVCTEHCPECGAFQKDMLREIARQIRNAPPRDYNRFASLRIEMKTAQAHLDHAKAQNTPEAYHRILWTWPLTQQYQEAEVLKRRRLREIAWAKWKSRLCSPLFWVAVIATALVFVVLAWGAWQVSTMLPLVHAIGN